MFNRLCIALVTLILPAVCWADRPADYWQQEVNYVIDVAVGNDLRTIDGSIAIEYINNSPDALDVLYLKAFPNAIQEGSYADKKRRSFGDWSFAGLKKSQAGSLELRESDSPNKPYSSFEVDNTIITIHLNNPILPGGKLQLDFEFTTVLPNPNNLRMGLNSGTSKAAYWYPQVCVYDRRMGWVNSQYIGWGECYGDFGDFDVSITAPEDQIVAATGVLVNSDEVLPEKLSRQLHIDNFLGPATEWPQIDFDKTKSKTWHYVAEKVSDFAFTYSNKFCIDSGEVNGVAVVVYPLRSKAKGWQSAVRLGKEAIETFSELYYPYQWPVMRVVDAFGGMEYPMLTNCSGQGPKPVFSMLLYHEIGHQWFMGQIGSNQVDRPFLDEGFTTHLEHVAMEKYYGRDGNYNHFSNWYQRKFSPQFEDRNVRGFRPLMLMIRDGLDKPGLFSYDQGEEYFPHRVSAYYKSAAMHYSLRSILGDSAYFDAMHHYCEDWFFGHPYEDDFTRSIEEATGLQLDRYLNQWYWSRHRLDYAFAGKETRRNGDQYEHTIKLKRPGRFVAPIDIAVVWEQGDTSLYTVAPEGMQYLKPGYRLMPAWEQFRRFEDKYEFIISSKRDIRKVIVDPDNLLIDIDRMNNQSGFFGPVEFRLDNILYDRAPVNRYALRWRPDLWYDQANGAQIGLHAHGSYLETRNRFSLYARYGVDSQRPIIDFSYATPFPLFGNMSHSFWRLLRADHRTFISSGWRKKFTKWHSSRPDHEFIGVKFNALSTTGNQNNLLDQIPPGLRKFIPDDGWDALETFYATLNTGFLRTFRQGSLRFNVNTTIGTFEEDKRHRGFNQNQARALLTLNRKGRPWLRARGELIFSTGEPPSQLVFHLSRAKAVDRFTRTQLFRSPGSFPIRWESDFYLSGERLRGYQDRSEFLLSYVGGSLELMPDLIPNPPAGRANNVMGFLRRLDLGIFGDFGSASMENKEGLYSEPVANGTAPGTDALPSKNYFASAGFFIHMPPLWFGQRLRLDFPLYLNRPIAGEKEFKFRFSAAWVLPVGG